MRTSTRSSSTNRRRFLKIVPAALAAGVAAGRAAKTRAASIGKETLVCTETVNGVAFTDAEHDLLVANVSANLENFETLRKVAVDDAVEPAFSFTPFLK